MNDEWIRFGLGAPNVSKRVGWLVGRGLLRTDN